MLATDLATALDPARLMEAAGLPPDPWQARLLRAQADRMLLLCSRQTGKSTVTGALALHAALYQPGALVLILAPALRQSQELFRKVLMFYRALDRPVPPAAESALSIELTNGSRIVSLPGKEQNVRGYSSVSLLIVDEAARVDDALYFSIRPMLAVSQGRLIALSTPFGKRGFFFQEWTEGGGEWARVTVPATECPRISSAFLEEERQALGDWWYSQEYECRFSDTLDSVFRHDDIMAAVTKEVRPLFGGAP
jgi:hypothetical protein